MKRKTLLLTCFAATSLALNAQQAPTGSPVPRGYTTAQQAASAWYRGGNNPVNTAGTNNIFGTVWNSPIYTITDNTYRTKLNGNVNYTLSGYAGNRNGNLLIGFNTNAISTGQSIYSSNLGAFSLLHINGPGSGLQEFGYRPWMQTGITFTGNRDLSYFGLRQVGTGEDVTETTITWSDNSGTSFPGPDDMVFRFTGNGNGSNLISTNYTTPDDLDGLHIARFAPTGEFALGNTFGINAPGTPANLYVRPQSLMHLSLNGNREV